LLLLAGRILQGFSAGGEIGSATAFLVEHAPSPRRGRYTAWLQASMGMSNMLGALVAFAVTTRLSAAEVTGWGWRIPFLFGLSIVPVGFYLREHSKRPRNFALRRRSVRRHGPVWHP